MPPDYREAKEPFIPGVGPMLVTLRRTLKISTKQLADALGVPERDVLEDERNAYAGLTVKRARHLMRVLESLERQAGAIHAGRQHRAPLGP